MRNFWLGLSVGILLAITCIGALIPSPQPVDDKKVFLYLRRIYDQQWNVPLVTTEPNSNRTGQNGDIVVFKDGSTYRWRINTSSTPGVGTTWSSITS